VVKARKRFAQHFLEPAWVAKLVTALAPASIDRFIEIGPGRGALTEPLARQVETLVAVEVDRDLAAALAGRAWPNVAVISADVLRTDLVTIARDLAEDHVSPAAVRVVGNLPYNISTPILLQLLNASTSGYFKDATLMLQKEVADRLVARPGGRDYGVLTLSTSLHADVRPLLSLPPGAFRPVPKVHSTVVRLEFRPLPPYVQDSDLLVRIMRSVFTQRRKTLANALTPVATSVGERPQDVLARAGIDPTRRPETLSLEDFARVASALGHKDPPPRRA
jgi:16S rRNA (adenine1518-N6/adenine1519-N6)-dimethyltransferase